MYLCFYFFFFRMRPPLGSTLFPYTTLFRSGYQAVEMAEIRGGDVVCVLGCGPVGQFALQIANCPTGPDRKSTRLNSSHVSISYAVFCLKKKKIRHLLDSDY